MRRHLYTGRPVCILLLILSKLTDSTPCNGQVAFLSPSHEAAVELQSSYPAFELLRHTPVYYQFSNISSPSPTPERIVANLLADIHNHGFPYIAHLSFQMRKLWLPSKRIYRRVIWWWPSLSQPQEVDIDNDNKPNREDVSAITSAFSGFLELTKEVETVSEVLKFNAALGG